MKSKLFVEVNKFQDYVKNEKDYAEADIDIFLIKFFFINNLKSN